jgi:hypothetical protein
VQIASAAGKAGFPGGATYCATKHAVVGLSEAIRGELHGTNVEVSVVMPVGVNTELYSGLPEPRGFTTAEPEDVANAIVEALQTGRYEVFVPKSVGAVFRFNALMPRRATEAIGRFLKGDQVLSHPDHAARSAYEQRMDQTVALAEETPSALTEEAPSEPSPSVSRVTEAAKAIEDTEAASKSDEPSSERETETV